ncbi:oxidoreductase [Alteriqipengyuania lutimaris]|uniref:Oxidoreductase n=1 Tax=Alteriqipengyuania lutimaris TaxID=1538146 RepID=A0A395LNS3_9SPHN|nr:oxidoreductase [Alteriqipengyuania lutimaris]MBB3032563.1 putative dehydrogenase [Alteriqipengyuania lutimaris]RDS78309.1 oxidoreductase [Alteriqipengyuania lutimaris]
MTQIGVGLVGYGLSGRVFHAPFVQATEGMGLRAVVSSKPEQVRESLPGMTVVPSIEALLAESGIDLVIVASPDDLHAEHAIAALEAGKHVLVEKPVATSLADAQRMEGAAAQAGRMLTVFHNRRWDADFLTLRRVIGEGLLGDIVHFESHFDRWKPDVPERWKDAREGGSWFDLGPHLVDQALCLFGMPEAVTLDLAILRAGGPAPDWFHTILRYPTRRVVLHSSKLSADDGLRFAVHGTGGSWIKHGADTQEPAIIAGAQPGDAELGLDPIPGIYTPAEDIHSHGEVPNERGDYSVFWNALASALRGEGANPVPIGEAMGAMHVLEAGMQSAREGRTVEL